MDMICLNYVSAVHFVSTVAVIGSYFIVVVVVVLVGGVVVA